MRLNQTRPNRSGNRCHRIVWVTRRVFSVSYIGRSVPLRLLKRQRGGRNFFLLLLSNMRSRKDRPL